MRLLLTLRFDGTAYHGWQVQKNALAVQTVVQDAIEKCFKERPAVSGCSRTDSGVHANMYCCHFDLDTAIDPCRVPLALNLFLPDDIAATDCRAVDDGFHARYSCTGKEYIYRFLNSAVRDPFAEKYSHRVKYPLDADLLNEAAREYIGRHDFSSFCAVNAKEGSRERTVFDSKVERNGDFVIFTVSADGFLYNMVRIMAGTLLRVGEGKFTAVDIPEILKKRDRAFAGPTVPAKGLFLNRVFYPFNNPSESVNTKC